MRFFIKIFYLSLVLYYVVTESKDVFTFNAISLGHSGLLITWKPNITTPSEETYIYYFTFQTYDDSTEEKIDKNTKFDDRQSYSFARKNFDCTDPKNSTCESPVGSYKIHSLNENTPYEIIIKQYNYYLKQVNAYSVKMRTNWKSKRMPAKPYFEFISRGSNCPNGIIRWYPCGQERICHDQESGTHFGITIKEPYNTRKLSEVNREEFYKDYMSLTFLPGRIYEVVVYSVNGECKTESDSQEIFFEPVSSPVQHVKIITLPDLSVLISWKKPKESLEGLKHYMFWYFNSSEPNTHRGNNIFFDDDTIPFKKVNDVFPTVFEQKRIFSLIPEVVKTFIIFPASVDRLGFEYKVKYKLQVYDHNLPLAKPDFSYKFIRLSTTCEFYFQWLPCGRSFDCKNTKPGSEYSFQVEPELEDTYYRNETGYFEGYFDLDLEYDVTVKSSIGSNVSEAVTKKFKNCDEI